MPTADQKDFIVDNGLDVNESITIGTQTVTSLVDSAQVSTIAREPANASAIALAGGASSKAYDSAELLPTSGNDSGDFGYVASTNRLYLWNGSGWYNIALVNTSPTVSTSPDSNYTIDGAAGDAVTVTLLAVDPEGQSITYTQTSDSASNFVNITQDSGVFTLTPLTKAQADSNGVGGGGTFSVTFKATDGVNIVPRVSSFTISWIINYNWLSATQQAQLTSNVAQNNAYFGSDVSLDEDASTAAIGSYGHDLAKGVGYIFDRVNTTWSQTAKLQISLSNRNSYQQAQFGYSAAISDDGNYAVFGAPFAYYSSNSYGKAFVFKKSSGTWAELSGGQLEASTSANRQNDDRMGWDVDIDKNGTRIIVGAYAQNHPSRTDAGGAYIFKNNGSDSYTYETFLFASDAANYSAEAGTAVALNSSDGSVAAVGAPNYSAGGSLYGGIFVYDRSGTTWTQTATLQPSDAGSADKFGYSCDIDQAGTTIVGSSYQDDDNASNAGAVYVFTKGTARLLKSIANTTLDHTSQPLSGSGLNSGATDPRGLTFNADGTKVYVTDNNHNDLSTYSLSTAFDVSSGSLSYDGDSYSFDLTATAGSTPYSPRFNNDGTRMYILEGSNDTIYQYNLTSAYDVSTMSYSNVSFVTTSQDSSARGIEFSPDGTKLYMVGAAANTIFQYTLSTPFDLSSASYDNKSYGVHSGPMHMVLHSAGTKMIVVTSGTNDRLYQYSLSTAYDISTASYDSLYISVANEQATPAGLALNNDGTKLFLTGNTGDNIDRYSLDTSFWSQAQKLTAPSTVSNNMYFGESVAIDNRGTKIIVGERYYNSQQGRAYVYRKVGSAWYYTKTIYASNPSTDDSFAKRVSLSGDGGYAALGAVNEDTATGENSGMVYIQKAPVISSGTTITDYGSCIVTAILEGEDNNEYQGETVALNKDGTLFAVGAANSDHNGTANAGAVRVYKKSSGTWSIQQTLTTNQFVSGTNNYYGKSLAIAADDYTIAVGMGQTTAARGIHIWTSSDSGATWVSQANVLGSSVVGGDRFGTENNIDLSDDGNTLIVGARFDDDTATDAGAVYVFTRSGTTWTQQAKLQASDAQASDMFGIHCRISGDGNYIAVGAPYEDGAGSGTSEGKVYIFYYNGSSWSQQAGFQANDPQSNTQFGASVMIDTDGNTVAISSSATTARCVYVFTRSGTSWSQQAKIERPNPETGDNFGYDSGNPAISGDGNILYIGSSGDDDNGNAAGTGFIYTRSGTTWSLQNSNFTPLASNYAAGGLRGVEANDYYGTRLAISRDGSTFAGGNYNHTNTAGLNTGAGYVMTPLIESY